MNYADVLGAKLGHNRMEAQAKFDVVDVPADALDFERLFGPIQARPDFDGFRGGSRVHSPEGDLLEQEWHQLLVLWIVEADEAAPLMFVGRPVLRETARLFQTFISVAVGDRHRSGLSDL